MRTNENELFKSMVTNMNNVLVKMVYINFLMNLPNDDSRRHIHATVTDSFREGVVDGWASPKADKKVKDSGMEFMFKVMGIDVVKEQGDVIDFTDKFIEKYLDTILESVLAMPDRRQE